MQVPKSHGSHEESENLAFRVTICQTFPFAEGKQHSRKSGRGFKGTHECGNVYPRRLEHALMGLCTMSLQPHNWSRWQNARSPATPGEKLPALWGSVLFLMHLFLRFPLKSCRPTRAKTLRQKTVRIVTSASFLTEWIRAPTMTFSPAGRRQRCSRVAEVPPAHRCTPWLSPSPTTRRDDALTRSRPSQAQLLTCTLQLPIQASGRGLSSS